VSLILALKNDKNSERWEGFVNVRQERFYLAGKTTNMDCIEALGEECALKKDGDNRPKIGFAA
jgi:hypothetical protein